MSAAHRVGIIGLGTVGGRFVDQFGRHDAFDLVAAWDPQTEACERHADRVTVVADAAAVVDACDVVYVAAPPLFHRTHVEAAIEREVAVFCEKPLGIDVEESRALVEAVEASGVPAGVNFVFASAPSALELLGAVESGELGDLVRGDLRLHFARWPRAWHEQARWLRLRDQGGWIREVVSHFLFLTARTFGPLTLETSSVAFPDGPDGELCEVDATARFSSHGGVPVTMIGTSLGVGEDVNDFTVRGLEASARVWDWYRFQTTDGDGWRDSDDDDRAAKADAAYTAQLDELAKLLSGEPSLIATFAEALAVQELVEQILRS